MERRLLQKCRVCGEWFNTTDAIMVEHFQSKHRRHLEKAAAIAKLVVTREMYLAKAKYEPWPQSQQSALAAQMAHDQLQLVIRTPC